MIYTGYFSKLNKYKELGLTPISICGKAPIFFKGYCFKFFAPSWDIFSNWKCGKITDEEYIKRFRAEILEKISEQNKEIIKNTLIQNDNKIILLCYEKPNSFCHRHIVSDWINTELGIKCEEFNNYS